MKTSDRVALFTMQTQSWLLFMAVLWLLLHYGIDPATAPEARDVIMTVGSAFFLLVAGGALARFVCWVGEAITSQGGGP